MKGKRKRKTNTEHKGAAKRIKKPVFKNPFTVHLLKYTALILALIGTAALLHRFLSVDLAAKDFSFVFYLIAGPLAIKDANIIVNFFRYRRFQKEKGRKHLSEKEYMERLDEFYKNQCRAQYEWNKRYGRK